MDPSRVPSLIAPLSAREVDGGFHYVERLPYGPIEDKAIIDNIGVQMGKSAMALTEELLKYTHCTILASEVYERLIGLCVAAL